MKKAAAPLPKQPKLSAAAEASSRLEQAESSRRLDAAVESGVLQRDRAAAYEYPVLHPAKDLRAQTLDISAKPKTASRATKYLIALPGHLAPIDGGAGVGQIEKLDTANPELLLDFHGKGKLRLRGTVVYPRSPFLTLQRKGSTLLSDDAFDNVIAFSAAEWLDGDGSGAPAALPESLNKPMHKSWSYEGGCAADNPTASKGNRRGGGGGKATKASPSKATKALAPSLDEEGGGGAGDGDSNDGDGDGDGDGGAPSAARSRSFRERKVQKYEDKGSDVEDGSDDDDVEITGELRRVSAGSGPSSSAAAKPASSGGGGGSSSKAAGKAKAAAAPKPPPAKKPKPPPKPPKEKDEVVDLDSSDGDDAPPKPKPKAKAASSSKKKKKAESSDDDDDDEYGGGSDDDDDEPAAAPSRGSGRGAAKKRKSYAESDDSAHDSDS